MIDHGPSANSSTTQTRLVTAGGDGAAEWDLDAEMSVLGSILVEPKVFPSVAGKLNAEDFYDQRHAILYGAMLGLHRSSQPIDPVLIQRGLEDRKRMEEAGGIDYVVRLAHGVRSGANAEAYAGIVARLAKGRRIVAAAEQVIYRMRNRRGDDIDTVAGEALDMMAGSCERRGGALPVVGLGAASAEVIHELREGKPAMGATGVQRFDAEFGGLPLSGLVSVYGSPGAGKTTLALTMLLGVAGGTTGLPIPVLVFSFEQPAKRIAATLLASESGLSVHGMLNRGTKPTVAENLELDTAQRALAAVDLSIVESHMAAPEIYAAVAEIHRRRGRGAVMIDYVQNLPGWGPYVDERVKIAESMRWAQRIARDFGWLVVVCSQVDKQTDKENRRPKLADGFGSAAIEQASDMVLGLWRPHKLERPEDVAGDMQRFLARQRCLEVSVLKSKYGEHGSIYLSFHGPTMRFKEPTGEEIQAWA